RGRGVGGRDRDRQRRAHGDGRPRRRGRARLDQRGPPRARVGNPAAGLIVGRTGRISPPLERAPRGTPMSSFRELLNATKAQVREIDTAEAAEARQRDRKSTRLNSSHVKISYAVFCL